MAVTLKIPRINDSRWDFNTLACLWREVVAVGYGAGIRFDFSNCDFLRPNAVVFLGALARLIQYRGGHFWFMENTMRSDVYMNLLQNGFAYAMWAKVSPWQGNSIPYREHFSHDKDSIVRGLKYEWLGRGWVKVSDSLANEITGQMAEIYANAFEHSQTPIGVYSCGQHIPSTQELLLAVADFGVGIPFNARCHVCPSLSGEDAMRWAFTCGHSTAQRLGPRGMGLALLKDFIRANKGQLEIYSRDGYARVDSNGEVYENLPVFFEGTLVQVRLVCDDKLYLLSNEQELLPYF
ncbi:hypothetical protein MTYM_00659 [Methylococcales bacterium]|nr:hypothetical protein MTYM_00659 [Methylococcales bacterium]